MDSVVKLGHQIKGDPVIRVCYLLQAYHFILLRMEKSPSDCFRLPCTGIFFYKKIIHLRRDSFLLQTSFVLLKGFALMMAETVTHFSWEGGSLDEKFQDVEGIVLFPKLL